MHNLSINKIKVNAYVSLTLNSLQCVGMYLYFSLNDENWMRICTYVVISKVSNIQDNAIHVNGRQLRRVSKIT